MKKDTTRKPFGQRLIASFKEGLEVLRSGGELPTTFVATPPDPEPFESKQLTELRKRYRMTQSALATFLNVSDKAVESWEQGTRKPNGAALRLLQVMGDPDIFATMFRSARASRSAAKIVARGEIRRTAARKREARTEVAAATGKKTSRTRLD